MNDPITAFNIRVYAICISDNKLLILREPFNGKIVNKLPGGGLEFGEGPVDCLKREFKEELNLEIDDIEPFYIQEEFIESFIKNNKQIVMLYFKAKIKDYNHLNIIDKNIISTQWVNLGIDCPLDLPVDKKMYNYLIKNM